MTPASEGCNDIGAWPDMPVAACSTVEVQMCGKSPRRDCLRAHACAKAVKGSALQMLAHAAVPPEPQVPQSDNAQGSATATPAPDSPSTSKGRLPHDRVGILEDRIQEDPRGDIPAWIELLNEHRGRSRIDSARDVYERFLQVFPFSVCPFPPLGFYATSEKLTIFTRLSNGWPTRTWNPSSTSCSVSSRSSIELF